MVDVPDVPTETITAAVDGALAHAAPGDVAHLARAVIVERIAAAANHRAHIEVTAACEQDDVSWADVGRAFGISPQTAEQRFRSAPMGLPG